MLNFNLLPIIFIFIGSEQLAAICYPMFLVSGDTKNYGWKGLLIMLVWVLWLRTFSYTRHFKLKMGFTELIWLYFKGKSDKSHGWEKSFAGDWISPLVQALLRYRRCWLMYSFVIFIWLLNQMIRHLTWYISFWYINWYINSSGTAFCTRLFHSLNKFKRSLCKSEWKILRWSPLEFTALRFGAFYNKSKSLTLDPGFA